MNSRHRLTRRSMGASLATVLTGASLIVTGPLASAAGAAGLADRVCPPPGASTQDLFDDDGSSVHEANINCAAQYDLVNGFEDGTFRPTEQITRGQMATFIANWIETASGSTMTRDSVDDFTDDDNSVHEANIEKLADNGIVSGVTATRFEPNTPVTRAQVATFTANAIRFVSSLAASSQDAFDDDDTSPHEQNINDLAAADVIEGKSASTYGPNDPNSRGQQATQGMEAGGYVDTRNDFAPTADLDVVLDQTTVAPGSSYSGSVKGSDVRSASVSGCGQFPHTLSDADPDRHGIQFTDTIPAGQSEGSCTLTFQITLANGSTQTITRTITVQKAASGGGVTTNGRTARPDLLSVTKVSGPTVGGATPGTTFRYSFDEPLTGAPPVLGSFHVYDSTGARDPFGAPASVQVDPSNSSAVLVRFALVDTQSELNTLTVATTEAGAATGTSGAATDESTEGDAPLNSSTGTTTLSGGVTEAPDVTSLGGFVAVAGATEIDFFFDETAFLVNAAGPADFHVVLTNGADIACTPKTPATAATTGATKVTVSCPGTPSFTISSVARGWVDDDAVSDKDENTGGATTPATRNGFTNARQATSSPDTQSSDPDLSSASFVENGVGVDDQVIFNFDEPVLVNGAATTFFVYDTNGDMVQGQSGVTRNPTNDRQVAVTFADGAITNAVGAGIDPGAVAAATGGGNLNETDEVPVTNSRPGVTAGRTAAPDLLTVTLEQTRNVFNQLTGTVAVYAFDEDLSGTLGAGNFLLYEADGTKHTLAGCARGTASDTGIRTVRCTTFGGATLTEIDASTLGAVTFDAVSDGALSNPEGANAVTKVTK